MTGTSGLARDSLLSIVFYLAPRVANVLLFVFIGRRAGPTEAGVFALANTYLILTTTSMRGLDELVVREVSRKPEQGNHYLAQFALLRLAIALLAYGVLALIVRVFFSYVESTSIVVMLFSLSVVPDSLAYVAQAVMMGQRRFAPPAVVLTTISILKVAAGATALALGYTLQVIAWIWLAGSCLAAAALLLLALARVSRLRQPDLLRGHLVSDNWRPILSFLVISTLAAFEAQTDTLVLSKFHSENQVGWYNAATTITYSLLVFSQAYRFSVYPLMTRYALQSREKLNHLYRQSIRYISMLALPMTGGLLVLAPNIVRVAFGAGFDPSVVPVQILSVALLFFFLIEPNSRMMLVSDRQRKVSQFLIVSTFSNITLNLILTPYLGAIGAAIARTGSSSIFFMLNYSYVRTHLSQDNLPKLVARALGAAAIMSLLVWVIRAWPLLATVSVGMLSYGILLCIVDQEFRNDTQGAVSFAIKWLRIR